MLTVYQILWNRWWVWTQEDWGLKLTQEMFEHIISVLIFKSSEPKPSILVFF